MGNSNWQAVIPFARHPSFGDPVERIYGVEQTIKASHTLGQGATENFVLQVDHRKLAIIFWNITANGAGTAVLTRNLQVQDPVTTANWFTVKTFAEAANFTGGDLLVVGPYPWAADATPRFNSIMFLPPNGRCRIQGVESNNLGDSTTYSVSMIQMEIT